MAPGRYSTHELIICQPSRGFSRDPAHWPRRRLGYRGPPRPNRRPPPSSLRSSAIWASPRQPRTSAPTRPGQAVNNWAMHRRCSASTGPAPARRRLCLAAGGAAAPELRSYGARERRCRSNCSRSNRPVSKSNGLIASSGRWPARHAQAIRTFLRTRIVQPLLAVSLRLT
jgi:hypothetical protein